MIAFFLGVHAEVSVAELRLLLGVKEQAKNSNIAVFDVTKEAAAQAFSRLGGTPKYGEILGVYEKVPELDNVLLSAIGKILKSVTRKEYVLSSYGIKISKRDFHHELKDEISGVKYDGKFEEAMHSPAASAHVMKRGGLDFSLVALNDRAYLVQTIQVQDAEKWTKMDMERPGRNMEIGMLPTKLARIMVNVTNLQPDGRLWDPFVGQGTIVLQVAQRGINALGTDKARISIEKAKQTMAWAINNKIVKHGLVALREQPIEKADFHEQATAIATEPFLGRPHFKPYSGEFLAKREWTDIKRLYESLLKLGSHVLKKGQRLVFVKPVFAYIAGREIRWYNPMLDISTDSWKTPEIIRDLGKLLWIQRDSVVGRELVILEKR